MSDSFSQYTYVTEHSPNCPSPYMVRMVGRANGQGVIDKLHPLVSNDAIGYGQTFEEAAGEALEKHLASK
jgi:hypothetical protein